VVRIRSSEKHQDDGSSSLSNHERREREEEKPLPHPAHKSVIFGHNDLTEKSENWEGQERV
jgi:hypothetical protein